MLLAMANCKHWYVAVDVGAHVGFHTISMAHFFERVHAYEPHPHNFECLKLNVTENVTCHNVALGAEEGTVSLESPLQANSGAWETVPGNDYPIYKLDDCFDEDRCDFIKIDVQGHENEVIRGAKRIIQEYQPTMIVELSKDEAEANKTVYKLCSYGLEPRYKVKEDMIFAPPGRGLVASDI